MRLAFSLSASTAAFVFAIAAADAPAQIAPLVPGIVVEELPVRLTNINNLRFTPVGKLSALAYNGRVYLLEDTNSDGLEDSARPYWDQATIRVPVGMAWSGRNLYVSSHGKLSLLHDTDGDGRAEREEIVSQGWPPTDVASGGVDATAVTLDGEGNVYFGLMCADYSNPYRLHEGKAAYDRQSLRGTILKLSPDHSRREVVCTGIRVPYALAFNRVGDLFVTDQEGETWLPGGNPLDELNHIVPGRHYGFPPRHPEHLADVVDEPPVVSFGPQHQSTCGLAFNDRAPGRGVFGPAWWEGNAFVAGLSRGRLWRVPLVKTPHGYVGKPVTIAISSLLLTDVALSPRGELYVSCHSGPPDWGAGPEAAGRLFRLRYAAPEQPQPVFAYPAGPLEVAVAFDRPLGGSSADVKPLIHYGRHVRSADRLETMKPPYAAVEAQASAHRGQLSVVAAELSADRRVLLLKTAPHPVGGAYALTIPGVRGEGAGDIAATVDLDYDLSGVQATWTPRGATAPAWQGWLPHVDTDVARALCTGSSTHERLVELWNSPGTLEIHGQLTLPPGEITLRLDAACSCTMLWGDAPAARSNTAELHSSELAVESTGAPRNLTIRLEGDGGPPDAHLSYKVQNGAARPIEIQRLGVPWAPPELPVSAADPVARAQPATGDARRGKELFFGQAGRCSTCHAIHGEGARSGPDLGNLSHRDRDSILRDVREPSAAVNPDYLGYQVVLRDGRTLSGTIRADSSGTLRIADNEARETVVARDEIEQIAPLAASIMPTGLLDRFSASDVDDLLAFLQSPVAAAPSPDGAKAAVRTPAEIDAVLRAVSPAPKKEPEQALDVVLVDGVQDHGPGEHDYPAWQEQWTKLLQTAPGLTVQKARDWPSAQQWRDAEVVVLYFWNHDWSTPRLAELDAFLARGGGVVVLHSALISDDAPEALATRFGLAAQPQRTKYRHGPTELHFGDKAPSPLVAGFSPLALTDETYWPMIGDRSKVTVLATAVEEGQEWPMLWTFESGKGRVFASILGHYSATYDDPLFRILILRGIAWTADEPPDRLQGLARPAGE